MSDDLATMEATVGKATDADTLFAVGQLYKAAMDKRTHAGLFPRRADLEVPETGCTVYVGAKPFWMHHVWTLLGAPSVVRDLMVIGSYNKPRKTTHYAPLLQPTPREYRRAIDSLSTQIMYAVIDLMMTDEIYGITAMDEHLSAEMPDKRMPWVIIEAARAGIPPCRIAREMGERFLNVDEWDEMILLHSGSQRVGHDVADIYARFENKGYVDFNGKGVLFFDPANATTVTSIGIIQKFMRDCGPQPSRTTFAFFFSTKASLEKMQKAFPGSIFVVGQESEDVDEKGYIRGTACGDMGKNIHGCPDHKSAPEA